MGKNEETIKICDGDEFELNRVQSTSTFSQVGCDNLSSTQQFGTMYIQKFLFTSRIEIPPSFIRRDVRIVVISTIHT
jgi:hypothetical protein